MTAFFLDSADIAAIRAAVTARPDIAGFTTNPTLMRRAGVEDYEGFARDVLDAAGGLPVSLEVFADTPAEIIAQAMKISSWGDTIYVKVPATTTAGKPLTNTIKLLSEVGVRVNVTAITTPLQVEDAGRALKHGADSFISVFAGRIADTGRAPGPTVVRAVSGTNSEVIWASAREVYNVREAQRANVDYITLTPDLLEKYDKQWGKDLTQLSAETVTMFHDDAMRAGYEL